MIPFDPFQSGRQDFIRLSRDACYLSNSSEQDEEELEIPEIAAIYEAICDPLPFFFRLSRKWREGGSGPPGDIRPTTNPFTTLS